MSTSIRSAEKEFHDALYTSQGDDSVVVPPEVVRRYVRPSHPRLFHLERLFQLVGEVRGKKALYLGCGAEASAVLLALKGADVVALDLSLGALQHQRKMAAANGVAGRIAFVVSAAEGLPFRSGHFDLVFGIGIWHHLQRDLGTPCSEVARVLKKDAHAYFYEPMARSRLVGWVRGLFAAPTGSPACTPLEAGALAAFRRCFETRVDPYLLFGRLDRFVTDRPLEFARRWKRWLMYGLHALDCVVFSLPWFHHLGGGVILRLKNSGSGNSLSAGRCRPGIAGL